VVGRSVGFARTGKALNFSCASRYLLLSVFSQGQPLGEIEAMAADLLILEEGLTHTGQHVREVTD
jgi:hypothetical protein